MADTLDIQAIRAMAEAATEGPWVSDEFAMEEDRRVHVSTTDGSPTYYHTSASICECFVSYDDERARIKVGVVQAERNAAFIASARTDVPALCDEVERLRAELAIAREEGQST